MSTLETQVGGSHYKQLAIQPVEFIHKNKIGFLEGNAIKYICRHRDKHGRQDIEKAIHYLQILLEMEYGETATDSSAEDGWIMWNGGECPIPDAKAGEYDLRYRCGTVSSASRFSLARTWSWQHDGSNSDIVAYRLHKQENSDGPDWSQAPEWAQWWAVDEGGSRWFYDVKPKLKARDRVWHCNGNRVALERLEIAEIADWTKSLTRRPKP